LKPELSSDKKKQRITINFKWRTKINSRGELEERKPKGEHMQTPPSSKLYFSQKGGLQKKTGGGAEGVRLAKKEG